MTISFRSPRLRNRVRVGLLAASVALACAPASSQNRYGFQHQGSILGDDVLYSIGGGRAVTMTGAANMRSIQVGVGWNSNLICGSMDIKTTIQNQLNGLTRGFQQIMSDVIQNATSAVASLPALIIQRADPGLYNLLTNGVLQARLDFDRSKLTCRAMASRLADLAGGQLGWDQIAEGLVLKRAVQSTDAVSAIEEAEESKGNEGVPWVGGNNAGGRDQPPVKIIADVTKAGYNLVNGREVEDMSSVDTSNCGDRLSCETWKSPQEAVDWATRVLGETEQRTCEDCTKTQTSPGVGLTPLIQEEFDARWGSLQQLIDGTMPLTFENLQGASSSSMPITRGVVEALRDEPDQELLARRLASEVSYSSVVEKALLLQRTLLTGRKEPNVAANDLAQQALDREANILDREIRNLKEELELRRDLMTNSPMAIIQRHGARAAGSGGVYQGDPVRNRLDELERPSAGGNP